MYAYDAGAVAKACVSKIEDDVKKIFTFAESEDLLSELEREITVLLWETTPSIAKMDKFKNATFSFILKSLKKVDRRWNDPKGPSFEGTPESRANNWLLMMVSEIDRKTEEVVARNMDDDRIRVMLSGIPIAERVKSANLQKVFSNCKTPVLDKIAEHELPKQAFRELTSHEYLRMLEFKNSIKKDLTENRPLSSAWVDEYNKLADAYQSFKFSQESKK